MPEDDQPEICLDVIMAGDAERVAARSAPGLSLAERMAILKDKPWEASRTLTVAFLDGDSSVQRRVEDVAHEWSTHANIRFDFGNDAASDIRISFRYRGAWSFIGKDANTAEYDEPTMNFGWLRSHTSTKKTRRVVLHEFGHALGAVHEHRRPDVKIPWDKPTVYSYYAGPPNYWNPEQVDQNVLPAYDQELTNFTEFDPHSIMIYPIPASLTGGRFEVGWSNELSDKDKALMRSQYPFESEDGVSDPRS